MKVYRVLVLTHDVPPHWTPDTHGWDEDDDALTMTEAQERLASLTAMGRAAAITLHPSGRLVKTNVKAALAISGGKAANPDTDTPQAA
jgi:hypothetical protein